jgi:TonB family protein
LKQIQFTGVSSNVREVLLSKLPVHEGDSIETDMNPRAGLVLRLSQAVNEVDEHLDMNLHVKPVGDRAEFDLSIFYRTPVQSSDKPEPIRDAQGAVQRLRVGGNVQAAMAISAPKPLYPPEAKQARIQGVVKLNVIIGKDGTVVDLKAASGPPELVFAALEAVRHWVYKPTLLNGNPVEVVTVVDVNFTLSQ